MHSKKLPASLRCVLTYKYGTSSEVAYTFPRLTKRDAEATELERIGESRNPTDRANGKWAPARRLSYIVENVEGWEDLNPRQEDESLDQFRARVLAFFNNDDMQEFADHALIAREGVVWPASTFRWIENSSVADSATRGESAATGA